MVPYRALKWLKLIHSTVKVPNVNEHGKTNSITTMPYKKMLHQLEESDLNML